MSAKTSLAHGSQFPYDASDKWWGGDADTLPPSPKDWAHHAARGIIADLKDRHTIKWGFENVDQQTRRQIVNSLAAIIRLAGRDRP